MFTTKLNVEMSNFSLKTTADQCQKGTDFRNVALLHYFFGSLPILFSCLLDNTPCMAKVSNEAELLTTH